MTKAPPENRWGHLLPELGAMRLVGAPSVYEPASPVPARVVRPCRHTDGMHEASFMVRGQTRAICQRELDRICTLPGIHATSDPTDVMPPGWIARAVLRPEGVEEPDGA